MKKKFKPRVLVTKNGNHIVVAEDREEWIFLRLWNCTDIGPL